MITIFKVAYMPPFTKEFHALMNEYMHPDMENSDNSTQQFEINQIQDTIQEEDLSLDDSDKKLLQKLVELGVDFIEIKTKYGNNT